MSSEFNIFFVCGAPKSGTTWVQRILDAHPEIACSGEGHFIKRFSGPAASIVNAYNQALDVEAKHVYEGRPYYDAISQAEFEDLVRTFILGRLTSRPHATGVRWLGDKTPSYTQQLPFLHRLFPQAKFVHVVRDPRDVAVSGMAHTSRLDPTLQFDAVAAQHEAATVTAARWRKAVDKVDAFAAAHPGLVHELRYRDLHADPMGEISRLYGFLGAPAPAVMVNQVVAQTSFEALAGRPAGQEDRSSFLRNGVPGDWKARLDPGAVRIIEDACGDLMRKKRFAA